MEKTSEASIKNKEKWVKNAYINQNKSKRAREGEINGLQGAKTGLYKAKCPQNAPNQRTSKNI